MPMSDSAAYEEAIAADARARERALDTTRSFLVQAPAGSGKTELLIQRYLALLAIVERPEGILAMTFTRKAAGEMRERIVRALAEADADVAVATPHERTTRALARAALAQDRRQRWELSRTRRVSECTRSMRSAPASRGRRRSPPGWAAPRFEERPRPLYEAAVRDDLAAAAADDPAWRRLLAHLDNDAGRAVALLATMLGKRDQWLRLLPGGDHGAISRAPRGHAGTRNMRRVDDDRRGLPAALSRGRCLPSSGTPRAMRTTRASRRVSRHAPNRAACRRRRSKRSTRGARSRRCSSSRMRRSSALR